MDTMAHSITPNRVHNTSEVPNEPSFVHSDAENNNVPSLKCKKLINNVNTPTSPKAPKQNEHCLENAVKIEITEHDVDHNDGVDLLARESLNNLSHKRRKEELPAVNDNNIVYPDIQTQPKKLKPEKKEQLFIRVVRLDISAKLNETHTKIDDSIVTTNKTTVVEDPQILPKLDRAIKKVSKTELQKQDMGNINKTESLKMEELLLKKFKKKAQEKQTTQGSSKDASENSEEEIETYVYAKTNKPVYETYEIVEDKSGTMILHCLLCPFTSEEYRRMSLHYKFKHRDTPIEEIYFCKEKGCKFKAVHKGVFKWHMRRHNMLATDKLISDLYPCGQCEKVFNLRKGLLIHLKHIHKDLPVPKKSDFPCTTCQYRAPTAPKLHNHIFKNHIPENKKFSYACNICENYKTHYKGDLKKHIVGVHMKKMNQRRYKD